MQTMIMEPTQEIMSTERAPEAIAEVFWLAFNALSEPEKQAVLQRLQNAKPESKITVKGVHVLHTLTGLVSWGGDAVEDSERLYDQ